MTQQAGPAPLPRPDVGGSSRRLLTQQVATVAVVVGYVTAVGAWGTRLELNGVELYLGAPPFKGTWRSSFTTVLWPHLYVPALLAALLILIVVAVWWVPATERLRFRWVAVGSWALSLCWTAALALTSAPPSLVRSLLNPDHEYLGFARDLRSPTRFVSTFLDQVDRYPTHVRGHPPGAVLAFWGLDRVLPNDTLFGLGLLLIAASAAPASLIAVKAMTDEGRARRVAVFAGLAPAVIWIGTSADALVMAVIAWAVTFGCLSVAAFSQRRSRPLAAACALASGLLSGTALTLSFGSLVLLAPLAAMVLLLATQRRWMPLAMLALGASVAPLILAALGYDWIAGYSALREQYYAGVAAVRPQWYFAFANVAAFAVAAGPAAIAGVVGLRTRRLWWLVGSALVGVFAADLSAMSKGEVERIWLPAVPWVVVATASIEPRRARRAWTVTTMAFTLALQWKLRPAW